MEAVLAVCDEASVDVGNVKMHRLVKYIFTCFCFLQGFFMVDAQTDMWGALPDTTIVAKQHLENVYMDFDATHYSLQNRYRSEHDEFLAEKFRDNVFFSVYGGSLQMLPALDVTFSRTGIWGFQAGKWLNKDHALRISLNQETFVRNIDNSRINAAGLDASYMFNLISYLWGYRQVRFCELATVAGLGYRASFLEDDFASVYNMHLGLNLSMKTGCNVDLFIEPLVYLHNGKAMHMDKINWRGYNLSSGAKVGFNYNIVPEANSRSVFDRNAGTFGSISGGPQFQCSELVYTTVGIPASMGPHLAASYGKAYVDGFALRSSIFWSMDTWAVYLGEKYTGHYVGLRLEAMYDFFSLLKKNDFPLAFSLLAGPEAGVVIKNDLAYRMAHMYLGLTGGAQLKCRIVRPVSVFIEPRFSILPYSDPTRGLLDSTEARANYFDFVVNMNFGVELSLPHLLKNKKG